MLRNQTKIFQACIAVFVLTFTTTPVLAQNKLSAKVTQAKAEGKAGEGANGFIVEVDKPTPELLEAIRYVNDLRAAKYKQAIERDRQKNEQLVIKLFGMVELNLIDFSKILC